MTTPINETKRLEIRPGDVVVIVAFDDVPEHLFEVEEVHDDCVTGIALSGPLSGCYGEPEREMILRVHSPDS
jgi:signal peptidase I